MPYCGKGRIGSAYRASDYHHSRKPGFRRMTLGYPAGQSIGKNVGTTKMASEVVLLGGAGCPQAAHFGKYTQPAPRSYGSQKALAATIAAKAKGFSHPLALYLIDVEIYAKGSSEYVGHLM